MLAVRLHSLLGYRPEFRFEVELVEHGMAHFARACGGEDRQLESQPAVALALAQPGHERRHLGIGHGCVVPVLLRLARQALGDRSHRSLALAVSRGIGPVEHGADPLAHPARRFRLRQPYLRQHIADHRTGDLADLHVAELREHIRFERPDPLLLVLFIPPGLAVLRQHLGGGFPKRRNPLRLAAFEQRIETQLDPSPHFARPLPRHGQRYFARTPQAEVPPVACPLYADHPALPPGVLDHQVQTVPVAEPAGPRCGLHGSC